jgi:hypothetical protein
MNHPRRSWICVACVGIALTAAACSSSSPKAASGGDPAGATTTATGGSGAEYKAVDACALLSASDIAALLGQATSKNIDAGNGPSPKYQCRWEGTAASSGVVPPTLNVSVTKAPPDPGGGVSVADLVKADASAENHGRVVDGLGDAATVTSAIAPNAEVKVLSGAYLLDVEFSGSGPVGVAHQDDVVALARMALAQLG